MSPKVNDMKKGNDEIRLAEEIVSILPAGVARLCSEDRFTIRFSVRGEGLKLKTIVLNRRSLRRLVNDPARPVKVEYLQRDLLDRARSRTEFRYPRLLVHPSPVSRRRVPFGLPVASMF